MIDLNADLAEGYDADDDLLAIVTSANIACGGHAGSREMMHRAVEQGAKQGVMLGAHPGYPDRESFGRKKMPLSRESLTNSLREQVGVLREVTHEQGQTLRYIKPHGALYHEILGERGHAIALLTVAQEEKLPLLLAPQAQVGTFATIAADYGVAVHGEGFADRGYTPEGLLLGRDFPGALITDAVAAQQQAVNLAHGFSRSTDGTRVNLDVISVCVHGDTPGSLRIAQAVRNGLEAAHIKIGPWGRA